MHLYIRIALLFSILLFSLRLFYNINIKRSKWHKIGNVVDSYKLALILIINKQKYTHAHTQLMKFTLKNVHTAQSTWHICIAYFARTLHDMLDSFTDDVQYTTKDFSVVWKIETTTKKKAGIKNRMFCWICIHNANPFCKWIMIPSFTD